MKRWTQSYDCVHLYPFTPDTYLNQVKNVAEKIIKSVEESLKSLKNQTITISIGVTEVQKNDNADIIYTLIKVKIIKINIDFIYTLIKYNYNVEPLANSNP